jgi:hypothetical protein
MLPPPEEYSGAAVLHGRRQELAGAGETGPTGHQTDHRGHRDDAGTTASSPRDNTRPRSGPRGVRAMAGGKCSPEHAGTRPTGHGSMNRKHREREGVRELTNGFKRDGGGSRAAVHESSGW